MSTSLVTGTATLDPGTHVGFSLLVPQAIRDLGNPNVWLSWAETVDSIDVPKFRVLRYDPVYDPRPIFTVGDVTTHEGTIGCGRLKFVYTLDSVDPIDVNFGFVLGSTLDGASVAYVYDPTIIVE